MEEELEKEIDWILKKNRKIRKKRITISNSEIRKKKKRILRT